jgi:hypothetical protein
MPPPSSVRGRITKPSVSSLMQSSAPVSSRPSSASKDYIRSNKAEAVAHRASPERAARNPDETFGDRFEHDPYRINPDFGRVPEYIVERQREREEARARAEAAAKLAMETPPGMKLMPDEERRATLEALEATQVRLNTELQRLPIVITSYAQRKRKSDLEKELDEVEAGIRLFSRSKVYIADDK